MSSYRGVLLRLALLVLFLAAVTAAGLLVPLPSVDALRAAVAGSGLLGVVAFTLGYALVTLTPVPKSALSIVAGVVGGFLVGAATVYVGALIGAAAAFGLGRRLGRDAVERLTGARIERIDRIVSTRGFLAVLIVRLTPVIPFTVINYAAGLTAVRLRDYALGTAIGIIPGDLAYVAVGAYGVQPGWGFWGGVAGLAVLTGLGAILGRRLRRRPEAPDA